MSCSKDLILLNYSIDSSTTNIELLCHLASSTTGGDEVPDLLSHVLWIHANNTNNTLDLAV